MIYRGWRWIRLAAEAGEIEFDSSPTGCSLHLQPCSFLVITSTRYYRASAAEPQIPHGIASRSAKPLLFNYIDKWVL